MKAFNPRIMALLVIVSAALLGNLSGIGVLEIELFVVLLSLGIFYIYKKEKSSKSQMTETLSLTEKLALVDPVYPFISKDKIPEFLISLSKSSSPFFQKVGNSIKMNDGQLSARQNKIIQQCLLWHLISETPDASTKGDRVFAEIERLLAEEMTASNS